MRLQGVIRKWTDGSWGVVHSYTRSLERPEKFFVHKSQLVDASASLDAGTRISFEIGPLRRKGDLLPAISIEVIRTQSSLPPVAGSSEGAR